MGGIITLRVESRVVRVSKGLGIFVFSGGRESEGIKTQHLELGAARRARENLAAVDIELRDRDRMLTGGAGRQGAFARLS